MARKKVVQSRFLGAVPWSAYGPGWSNCGFRGIYEDTYEDGSTRVREESVYQRDFTSPDQLVALRVGLEVRGVIERPFRERDREVRGDD